MTLKLDNQAQPTGQPDDGMGWYKHEPSSSEYEPPQSADENNSQEAGSASDDLRKAELGGDEPADNSSKDGEQERLNQNFGYNHADSGNKLTRMVREWSVRQATKRNKIIGGSLLGVFAIVIVTMLGFSAFEAIHVRENMLGNGNRLVNQTLQNRRAKSFARIMRKMSSDATFANKLNSDKLTKKLMAQGFTIGYDPTTKKVNHLEFTSPDDPSQKRVFDFDEPDLRKSTKDFFGGDDLGREISRNFDNVTGIRAATWKGRAARRLYGSMGVRLTNWVDGRKPTANAQDDFADRYSAANAGDRQTQIEGRKPASSLSEDVDGDGVPDRQLAEGFENLNGYDDITPDMADQIEREALSKLQDGSLSPAQLTEIGAGLGTRYPSLGSRLTKLSGAFNLTEVPRMTCRIKGTLNFVSHVKNTALAAQMAKFSLRYVTVADHQKAGLIKSDGMKIMMAYMHTPNPATGKSYTNAGGFRNTIMGEKNARPSENNLARFSTGRNNTGTFGTIKGVVDGVPLSSPDSCKFVNNGFVQVGGGLIGVGAALFSGGTITAGNAAAGFAMGMLEELAFMIAVPLIQAAVTNDITSVITNGEMAGDALGSGWGVMRGMNAGSNGLRPIARAKVAALEKESQVYKADEMRQQSLYARYFDLKNTNSMGSKLAFATVSGQITPKSVFSNFLTLLPGQKVLAANEECQDPEIQKLQIHADIFCNPEMAESPDLNTDQTEQVLLAHTISYQVRDPATNKCAPQEVPAPLIKPTGEAEPYPNDGPGCINPGEKPTIKDDLTDYIAYCHSGRPGVLYHTDVNQDGTSNPEARMDPHEPAGSTSLTGRDGTQPCFYQGPSLKNDPDQNVGRWERYTDWYGYFTDEENIIEDINESYSDTLGGSESGSEDPLNTTEVISGDTSHLVCEAGTDGGVQDGYQDGQRFKIRICVVRGIKVNAQIARNIDRLLQDAERQGILLSGGGFRTMESQIALRTTNGCPDVYNSPSSSCRVATARPGYSNHQMGLAIDFSYQGRTICFPRSAASCGGNRAFDWLKANAGSYGLINFPKEAWHWSTNGK